MKPVAALIKHFKKRIYLGWREDFYAFHNDGAEVEFAPVTVDIGAYGPASVEDIDGDGDFDFISGTIAGALIIDCKLAKGTKIPWSTYRGNYRRTGYYGDNKVVTGAEKICIIPPPIDTNIFRPLRVKHDPEYDLTILYIGSLHPKRLPFVEIFKALKRIQKERIRVRLIVFVLWLMVSGLVEE